MKLRDCKALVALGIILVFSSGMSSGFSSAISATSLESFSSDIISSAAVDVAGNAAAYIKMDEFGYYRVARYNFGGMNETYISAENSMALDSVLANDDFAVWFDARIAGRDVYFSNLKTGVETRVTTTPNIRSNLSLSGNFAVYAEYGLRAGIYVANLSETKPVPVKILALPENNQFDSYHMNTFDGITYVVFVDPTKNAGDIKLYNCNTGELSEVANSEFAENNPVVANGHVYYTIVEAKDNQTVKPNYEEYNAPGSVRAFNLATKETTVVLEFDDKHFAGVVKNVCKSPLVIWEEAVSGPPTDFRYHILSDGKIDVIKVDMANERVRCSENCADGNFVAFRFCNLKSPAQTIKVYDVSNKTMITIDDSEGIKTNPKLCGSRIIFTKADPENKPFYRIFGLDIK